MVGETGKIYPALHALYKATIILTVRWSFERAGFLLDLENIGNSVQIDPIRVLNRILVSDFELDDCCIDPNQMTTEKPARNAPRKRKPIPKPSESVVSLAAYSRLKNFSTPNHSPMRHRPSFCVDSGHFSENLKSNLPESRSPLSMPDDTPVLVIESFPFLS
jgi:hypothetical protein